MPKRTPLRGSVVVEIVSIDCWAAGWSTLLIRSIFFERSKPRYSAVQAWPAGIVLVALWSHGPRETEEFLKLPPASAKKPTVLRPPRVVPLAATMAPAPFWSVGS